MNSQKIITVDGPLASGKSTVSRLLAQRIGWKWLSTGAFYRGLALLALQKGVSLSDQEGLCGLVSSAEWQIVLDEEQTQVYLGARDVTDEVYLESTGAMASQVARYPKVRAALLSKQREFADRFEGLIAEGRDCGTVVFPNARLKVYLTASAEARIKRRAEEYGEDIGQVRLAQKARDDQDRSRVAAPLQIPEGALVVDTSASTAELAVERILTEVAQIWGPAGQN